MGRCVAWLMGRAPKPLVMRGTLSWGSTVLAAGIILYFSQIPGAAFDKAIDFSRHDTHFLFTLAFALVIGVAAMVNTRYMTGKLGFNDAQREVGRKSGLAAAAAFSAVSMILLFGLGWEVGRPGYFAGYRYSMLVIMYWCNVGAALAGGAAMGWILARVQVTGAEWSYLSQPQGQR